MIAIFEANIQHWTHLEIEQSVCNMRFFVSDSQLINFWFPVHTLKAAEEMNSLLGGKCLHENIPCRFHLSTSEFPGLVSDKSLYRRPYGLCMKRIHQLIRLAK